jgi:hypothetical protein
MPLLPVSTIDPFGDDFVAERYLVSVAKWHFSRPRLSFPRQIDRNERPEPVSGARRKGIFGGNLRPALDRAIATVMNKKNRFVFAISEN